MAVEMVRVTGSGLRIGSWIGNRVDGRSSPHLACGHPLPEGEGLGASYGARACVSRGYETINDLCVKRWWQAGKVV